MMEPQWNPAAEAQAIDRIHRLGQKKPVICVRYIMANSFEEKILKIQEKKNNLANITMEQGKLSKAKLAKQRLEVCFLAWPCLYSGGRCEADFLAAFEGPFQRQEVDFRFDLIAVFSVFCSVFLHMAGFRLAFVSGYNGCPLSHVFSLFAVCCVRFFRALQKVSFAWGSYHCGRRWGVGVSGRSERA